MAKRLTSYLVLTFVGVILLIAAGAIVFGFLQHEPSRSNCLLFAVKAITTSGVPDNLNAGLERFLIGYLPISVAVWASMIDALISR